MKFFTLALILAFSAANSLMAQSDEDVKAVIISENEITKQYSFVPLTFGTEFGAYSLIYAEKEGVPHFYMDFYWAVNKTKTEWKSFQFKKSDVVQITQKNGEVIGFTNFDTTYTSRISDQFVDDHSTTYNLFHAVFEISKSQLDAFTADQVKRISAVTNTDKQIRAKVKGKRFSENILDFYTFIETKTP